MVLPFIRPRRLRENDTLRDLVKEHRPLPQQLILPLFVSEEATEPEPIASMPGIFRHTLTSLIDECQQAWQRGIRGVILFGIPQEKDGEGTQADAADGIVQQAIRTIKKNVPEMMVMTDVCLCEYTDHGHCGIIETNTPSGNPTIDNDATLPRLGATAVSHVQAGADVVAPSAMMDGQVAAIRRSLDAAGFSATPIMAYSAKFASAYYGPFRDAAQSVPQFADRKTYQIDPANGREGLREIELDLSEGADIVMVKPALAYLDIMREARHHLPVPMAAYNVSGEYSMIKAAAQAGYLDEQAVVLENLTAFVRAGADLIITYHAMEAALWL